MENEPKPKRKRKYRRKPGPKRTNGGAGGRPSVLNDKLFAKLRIALLKGETYDKFAKDNNIPIATVWKWHYENYRGFSEKADGWKRDRIFALASGNLEEILQLETKVFERRFTKDDEVIEKDGEDPALLRIKSDMTKFTLETLGKTFYARRSELTGLDGKDLVPTQEDQDNSNKALDAFLGNNSSRDSVQRDPAPKKGPVFIRPGDLKRKSDRQV